MCFVKSGDLKYHDDIELLSSGKKVIHYKIRKLIESNFVGSQKYKYLRYKLKKTDEEILNQLEEESELAGLEVKFANIIASGKNKVDTLLEF